LTVEERGEIAGAAAQKNNMKEKREREVCLLALLTYQYCAKSKPYTKSSSSKKHHLT